MSKADVLARIRKVRVIPVLRAESVVDAYALARAITKGGIPILEVTMTIPGALTLIRTLIQQMPEVLVGAGSVLDPETARKCILEGVRFIVSPALNFKTVELCQQNEVAVFPGGLTPTEIVNAWQAGADAVKVFPAGAMGGPSYLRSIRAPLPDIPLIPTGGVSLANAKQFFEAGAFAIGVGAELADTRAVAEGRTQDVIDNARRFLETLEDRRYLAVVEPAADEP